MDFAEIWEKHKALVLGGGAALAILAVVLLRRSPGSPPADTATPASGGGGGDGTAAAIGGLGDALSQQSSFLAEAMQQQGAGFSEAMTQMQAGQQEYFSALAGLMQSHEAQRVDDNSAHGSQTTVTYVMPPPAAAPTTAIPSSYEQISHTYGYEAIYSGEAEANHAASDAERLKVDPGFRKSEIDRALQVIDFRKKQNLDTADQQRYLSQLMGN